MSSPLDYLVKKIGYDNYNNYLKSVHWTSFCDHVRKSYCFCCGRNQNLQIHHITYESIGRESPNDVITVCDSCHILIHDAVSNGAKLISAHHLCRNRIHKANKQKRSWVPWQKLLNKSKKQTLTELQSFLEQKGLMEDRKATDKAYKLHFVKLVEGVERWNQPQYIKMVQADNEVRKQLRKGQTIHPASAKRALL